MQIIGRAGKRIELRTYTQGRNIVYEVVVDGALRWARSLNIHSRQGQREDAARTQERVAEMAEEGISGVVRSR